ncbi:nucleoplasmin-like protein isoform X1 [Diprion similis]|uniref:nucleoplasmin-like protein isoform X1 n=1 Tax=Diprion similis TaxID=362088 RepID=UPI001EF91383|nr:nucleoplasmin-like protein isoform X1 [Diprion similis]XP_046752433.1 nucleoplasmin-like protein isoform X1 [Diprion similis]
MAEEYLYGITLEGPNATEVWDPEHKNEDVDGANQHFGADQKLIIKMALLGPEAKAGELNVLQVEAMGLKGPIKTPIALLELGKTAQIILDLSFPDPPVTFTLIKGSGPVHIVGHNLLGTHMDEFEDMEDEMEEENIDDEDDEKASHKKRKLSGEGKKNGTKRAKMDEEDPEDEEDEDEEPKKKNAKLAVPAKNKNQANKNKKK